MWRRLKQDGTGTTEQRRKEGGASLALFSSESVARALEESQRGPVSGQLHPGPSRNMKTTPNLTRNLGASPHPSAAAQA